MRAKGGDAEYCDRRISSARERALSPFLRGEAKERRARRHRGEDFLQRKEVQQKTAWITIIRAAFFATILFERGKYNESFRIIPLCFDKLSGCPDCGRIKPSAPCLHQNRLSAGTGKQDPIYKNRPILSNSQSPSSYISKAGLIPHKSSNSQIGQLLGVSVE